MSSITNSDLVLLARSISHVRQRQIAATIGMMLVGAVAELVTIGAVLPLLIIATDFDQAARLPLVAGLFGTLHALTGWSMVAIAALILVVVTLVSAIIRLHLTWMTQKLIYGIGFDLGMAIIARFVHQPYEHYVRQNSSVALTALTKVHSVTIGIISPILLGITSAGIAIGILALLMVIDPVASLIAAATIGILYIGISVVSRRRLAPVSIRNAQMWTERTKIVQEMLGGMRDITLDRSQAVFEARLERMERDIEGAQTTGAFLTSAPRFVVESAGIILIAALALWFNARPGGLVAAIPQLGALAVGAQRLLPLLQTSYLGWASQALHRQALRDVLDILEWPIAPVPTGVAAPIPFEHRIELRDLSYRYHDGHAALTDIDLTITKGERIGIIGRTGSGKSTLADLLMGLLTPSAGSMIVDGKPLTPTDIVDWQAMIAHVPQSIFLSDDSITENIAFGIPMADIDMDRVRSAAARADILNYIETLPAGFATVVGERGIRLSGGQRQRIGIARALYRDAKILFFDEATSALDTETETEIMNAVFGLDKDLTVLLIAHRLSTLDRCDVIYRLDGGRIVSTDHGAGTHALPVFETASAIPGEERS